MTDHKPDPDVQRMTLDLLREMRIDARELRDLLRNLDKSKADVSALTDLKKELSSDLARLEALFVELKGVFAALQGPPVTIADLVNGQADQTRQQQKQSVWVNVIYIVGGGAVLCLLTWASNGFPWPGA